MLLDCFENFAIRKRDAIYVLQQWVPIGKRLFMIQQMGAKKKKAHKEGTPRRLSHSLQQNCSLEKLLRSTIMELRMYKLNWYLDTYTWTSIQPLRKEGHGPRQYN